MKIIDAHNHPDWHDHDLNKSIANMDNYGISKAWLMSWECPENEYDFIYNNKERAPERFVLGYCPDPRLPDACRRLEAANKIYGAEVCGELKCRMMYDSPDALRLFKLAGELGMPVTFHLQYDMQRNLNDPRHEWWGGTIDTIERVLRACPDTVFLGHAPGFWIHISNDELWRDKTYPAKNAKIIPGGRVPELLKKYPNLYCDISAGSGFLGLKRDPKFAKLFLTKFQDRILYARDYFDNQHQDFINSLNLATKVLKKIYHANAEKLINACK